MTDKSEGLREAWNSWNASLDAHNPRADLSLDTFSAGFKAGLERAARLAEERSPPWPPMVYSPTRGTGPAKIFTPSPRSKRFDGGVGPR